MKQSKRSRSRSACGAVSSQSALVPASDSKLQAHGCCGGCINAETDVSASDVATRSIAELQTTLAVTRGQLSVVYSQLKAKDRELSRLRDELRTLENSLLDGSCTHLLSSPTSVVTLAPVSAAYEALLEGVNTICTALDVKGLPDTLRESRTSSVLSNASFETANKNTEQLPQSRHDASDRLNTINASSAQEAVNLIDKTIAAITASLKDRSTQINFLSTSLDVINTQLNDEREVSRELMSTVSQLRKSNALLSEELIELRVASAVKALPDTEDQPDYSLMSREDLVAELQNRDAQLAVLRKSTYASTLKNTLKPTLKADGDIAPENDQELAQAQDHDDTDSANFVTITPSMLDDANLANIVLKFISDYRSISTSLPVTSPDPSTILNLLMEAVKLRLMSKHKLMPGEIEKDVATIEASFILRQMNLKDKKIARLKELLSERDLQLSQLRSSRPESQKPEVESVFYDKNSSYTNFTPAATMASQHIGRANGHGSSHGDLQFTIADTRSPESVIEDMTADMIEGITESIVDGQNTSPVSPKEAVVISFSARLKKVPLDSVKNYGTPIYQRNGLTVASRFNLGQSPKTMPSSPPLRTNTDDLLPQDLSSSFQRV